MRQCLGHWTHKCTPGIIIHTRTSTHIGAYNCILELFSVSGVAVCCAVLVTYITRVAKRVRTLKQRLQHSTVITLVPACCTATKI